MDIQDRIMEETTYGKAALKKLAPTPENFRIYSAEWLGDKPSEMTVMKVVGAEFRAAKTGPNKGKLSIMIHGSKRTAYVSKSEMQEFAATTTPDQATEA